MKNLFRRHANRFDGVLIKYFFLKITAILSKFTVLCLSYMAVFFF